MLLSALRHRSPSVSFMVNRSMSNTTPTSRPLRLPRLPVPSLRDTLDRYLKSLEPFLLEDEARGRASFQESMGIREAWAKEFELGLGQTLQERLVELDKTSPYNWLDDNFWLKKAYLEWRTPLPIHSNWWLAYKNDQTVPSEVVNGEGGDDKCLGISSWQIRRAAWLLSRTLEFKDRFESQEIHPDTTRTGLWMHNAVPRMFNVCRIPQLGCDALRTTRPTSTHRNKVIVMLHDWIYAIDVYDESLRNVGHREIERRLRYIVLDAKARSSESQAPVPVGVLSSDDRDEWTKNRNHLLEISPINRNSLDIIEDSILAISLDPYTHTSAFTGDAHPSEIKSHLHNIRAGRNARNRWFDKGISLIVESNARAGMMGEHSPVDALVPSIVADYSLAEDIDADWEMVRIDSEPSPEVSQYCERLDFVVDDHIRRECKRAEDRATLDILDSDDDVLWFTDYGKDWIKNKARLSPDAYIQLAMQLAWYRTRGAFTATYETALTRVFEHGRTETIRTLSSDSRQFVLAMLNSAFSSSERRDLLERAIVTHGRLTKAAATGKGMDRHLLGLRLVMKSGENCALFEDELFARSQEWKLSTSGLTAGEYFRGTGFGAPYHDGYGINYLTGADMIKFGIESKISCQDTSTSLFKDAIALSLREMKQAVENTYLENNEAHAARL